MANREPQVFQNGEGGKLLVSAISAFALELYKQQTKRSSGNMFMSPFSISAVLNMAYLGARGKTLEEMKTVLSFDNLDDSKLHQAFSDIIFHLKRRNEQVDFTKEPIFKLYTANRLYEEQSYKFLEQFQTSCKKYYDAEPTAVDFCHKPDEAAELINSWVLEFTNQKIKDIIQPNSIDQDTRLILVNAIYFKSAWQDPFEKHITAEADFFPTPGETVKVQMMFQELESARYYKSGDIQCQVLKLPYKQGALSMFIILPDKSSTSLEEVEKKLTADYLVNIDSQFEQDVDVNLWLPKFKMEETLELKDVLHDMGMKSLFTIGSADLSGIDGSKQLYASKVVHKAFVDVNEEGTEAAAATAMKMMLCCLRIAPVTVDFRAEHPFMFLIREEQTKVILFIGRVVRPLYH